MASHPPPHALPPAPTTPYPAAPPPLQQQQQTQPGPAPAGAAATLLVRHLPEAITQEMLSRLFSHYGATSIRPCAGGKLRNCAFVDFRDEAAASHAHSLLNRLRFLGKVLIVERANQPKANDAVDAHVKHQDQLMPGTSQVPSIGSQNQKNPTSIAEPIAPKLGVDYPFPPHLEYSYPPPDGNILTNVVNALIAVPRFYNQEDVDKRKSKRAKHESIVGPAVDKSVAHEAVGVKPAVLVSNELQVIKKKNPVLQIKIAPKLAEKEQPIPSTTDKELNSTHEQHEEKHFVTPQEIDKEKLPPEKILSLPMFKNYTPGNPASVLYIKNLAKDFTCDDFFYIFDASGSIAGVNERVVCNAAFI
ncbi:hypothetical protein U9M48_040938 [Paspalum notatum var. saurae]|uniref:RRM domain-containing protein n=1 Tax=Paspalum notatum var. saurae TaxID=547442 RepID=A0AAQ3URL4_PASNO